MASVIFKCEDAAQQNDPERPRPQRHIDAKSNGFELAALPLDDASPPAKPGACVSLERAYCRQASQEALKKTPPASLALRPVNGRRLSKIIFLAIVKLFISSRFARCWKRKLFTLPSSAGGCHFAKAYKTKNAAQPEMTVQRFFRWCEGRDLNSHGVTTRPSNVRACRFRSPHKTRRRHCAASVRFAAKLYRGFAAMCGKEAALRF